MGPAETGCEYNHVETLHAPQQLRNKCQMHDQTLLPGMGTLFLFIEMSTSST